MQEILIERTKTAKQKPDFHNLGFGRYFSDHMFLANHTRGRGWHDARVVPYGPFTLEPAAMVFHYAQESFEGLKAYRAQDGRTLLFRPMENIRRMNRTHARLCIPEIDEGLYLDAIKAVIKTDLDWVPALPGASLYIRPFVIATDPFVGVRPSDTYIFCIILSPVDAYYPEGMAPVKILIETEDVRAVRGGTGEAKTGGNYAATLRAQDRAKREGYTQVLWLDGRERRFIEEVGTMNVFFQVDGTVITPSLEGSILPGVTRSSAIALLSDWGIPVQERQITLEEIEAAIREGRLEEAFGTGTAAVISPIGELNVRGEKYKINNGRTGPVAQRLYDELTAIQWGASPDRFGWTMEI